MIRAAAVTALLGGATGALAQQPAPLPDQAEIDRALNPKPPAYENPIDRRIRDAIRKLGLPPQPDASGKPPEQPPGQAPGLSDRLMPELDGNRDGYVSRDEYFRDRMRPPVAGSEGTARSVERYRHFRSRFRAADRDRDGRLSPEEIDAMQGRRF